VRVGTLLKYGFACKRQPPNGDLKKYFHIN
jgi:hypothetical protein